jgi:HD superfamily phosphohydrolase
MSANELKRITDAVHGTIGLNDLEVQVMNTQVFQRLRNVKQLGLADYVFPGAAYSRLSHSLGACHVTGRILDALEANDSAIEISDDDYQLYRIAALLHDVGHYPFSHAMEEALKNHYKRFGKAAQVEIGTGLTTEKPLNHEKVGREIVRRDTELRDVLAGAGIEPDDLEKVFQHDDQSRLANIISSDLDADRIDYLLRTARHTGLPYGSIDLEYLLSQLRLDANGRLCIRAKAVRTADHFLLSRYFDYQQISFHKTVAAFELVLKDVISALLQIESIHASAEDVKGMIDSGDWRKFDDSHITQKIIDLAANTDDDILRLKTHSILNRHAPKLVYRNEKFKARAGDSEDEHLLRKQAILRSIPDWAEEFDIDPDLWYVWDKPGIPITKVGSTVPIASIMESSIEEDSGVAESIFVLEEGNETSQPIVGLNYSLLKPLSDIKLYALRLYVIVPPDRPGLVDQIKSRIQASGLG